MNPRILTLCLVFPLSAIGWEPHSPREEIRPVFKIDGDVLITGCNGDTITSLSSGTWVNANQENVGVGFVASVFNC